MCGGGIGRHFKLVTFINKVNNFHYYIGIVAKYNLNNLKLCELLKIKRISRTVHAIFSQKHPCCAYI